MIKKKEVGDQAVDGKQPILGRGFRQTCTCGISSLTPPIIENFIEARR